MEKGGGDPAQSSGLASIACVLRTGLDSDMSVGQGLTMAD